MALYLTAQEDYLSHLSVYPDQDPTGLVSSLVSVSEKVKKSRLLLSTRGPRDKAPPIIVPNCALFPLLFREEVTKPREYAD